MTQDSVIWTTVLAGRLSTLARLQRLANCRDPVTRIYHHDGLIGVLNAAKIDPALRAFHQLFWQKLLDVALEELHADLILYLHDSPTIVTTLLSRLEATACTTWAPDSAGSLDKMRFQSNLGILLELRRNQCEYRPGFRIDGKGSLTTVGKVLRTMEERYAQSDLTLRSIARQLYLSSRHLGRLFLRGTKHDFRQPALPAHPAS